jgi:nitrogen fixation NifU-like protein
MTELYRDHLMAAARDTSHRGILEDATIIERKANPSCGDAFTVYAVIEGNELKKVSFDGTGCVISTASATMVLDALEGKTIDEILAFGRDDVMKCLGAPIGPMREGCALLALEALQRGITVWKKDSK